MFETDNGKKLDFVPVKTTITAFAESLFSQEERNAFLKQHLGGGSNLALRWGNNRDAGTVYEMAGNLPKMLAGDPRAWVASYWETSDGRYLSITSQVAIGIGITTFIDGGSLAHLQSGESDMADEGYQTGMQTRASLGI